MKRSYIIAIIALVGLTAPVSGLTWTKGSRNGAIHKVESDIQSQLARIQRAKDVSSSATALTKIRVADKLHRAEQELERHLANLERMRESLEDQAGDLVSSHYLRSGQQQQGPVGAVLSRIEVQIRAADALLARVEAFRRSVDEPAVPSTMRNRAPHLPFPDNWASKAKAGPAESSEPEATIPEGPLSPPFR